jgi:hypothetical protein
VINRPMVTDNDDGDITITYQGRELRSWFYNTRSEQCTKMQFAREYIEGWCDGHDHREKNYLR